MRRGTTPTHIFMTAVDLSSATVLYVTYKQLGRIVIEKSLEDGIALATDHIEVPITQEETLGLNPDAKVYIQVRAGFSNGARVASRVICTTVGNILKDGEI